MPKPMMLLINPNAGRAGYKASIAEIMDLFCEGGYVPCVYYTRASGNASEIVEKYAGEYPLIVCLGGDGTLSEVTAGLMRLEKRPPIGYIPLGTANDVARTLELSRSPVEAARNILRGRRFAYDVGRFGVDKYFIYIAAFGAFTEVSYATPPEAKHILGHLAYMLEGMKSLGKLKSYRAIVEWDEGTESDEYIFGAVMNSTSMGGLVHIADGGVDLSDGLNEVLLVKKPTTLTGLNDIIASVLSGNFTGEGIRLLRSREVRVMFEEPVPWTRDGEDGGAHRDVLIENCHPGVEIII